MPVEDEELTAIRAARLAQLQQNALAKSHQGVPMSGASASALPGMQDNAEDTKRREAEESMKRDMLATVLEPAARERLTRIALVSPARTQQIESILIRMAQTGQLRGRVGEEQLISLLKQADDAQQQKTTIVYQRRKEIDDDDDFDFDL